MSMDSVEKSNSLLMDKISALGGASIGAEEDQDKKTDDDSVTKQAQLTQMRPKELNQPSPTQ